MKANPLACTGWIYTAVTAELDGTSKNNDSQSWKPVLKTFKCNYLVVEIILYHSGTDNSVANENIGKCIILCVIQYRSGTWANSIIHCSASSVIATAIPKHDRLFLQIFTRSPCHRKSGSKVLARTQNVLSNPIKKNNNIMRGKISQNQLQWKRNKGSIQVETQSNNQNWGA